MRWPLEALVLSKTPLEIMTWDRTHFNPCSTKEETESQDQREEANCPRSHSALTAEIDQTSGRE